MAGDVFQLGLAGGPLQSFAPVSGTEKAPGDVNLLHAPAQGISVHHQTRHPVFRRATLEAATAYVAALAVAFLILVCVRRVSNLSVAGGGVRSLADAEANEPAGACGGSGEGGGEDEKHMDEKARRAAIVEQARKNIESFRGVIDDLKKLKRIAVYRSSSAAVSTYILLTTEMGVLGIFIDRELRAVRRLWREVMHEAINSALILETGWEFANSGRGSRDIHMMNGDLVGYLAIIAKAKKLRQVRVSGKNRFSVLEELLPVQPVTASLARAYLHAIHPESDATRSSRQRALGRLAAMTDSRRLMILAHESYSAYFEGFFLPGFARQRFGRSCGPIARSANPPLNPEDQIKYLQENFPMDLSAQSWETAAAVPPQPLPDEASPSTHEGAPMHAQGPPMHPQGPPAGPPGPPPASGPRSQGPYSFERLGARPRRVVASSGQKSRKKPSKQPSPEGPKVKGTSYASSLNTKPKKPPGSASDAPPVPPKSSRLTWPAGPGPHRRHKQRQGCAPNDVAQSGTREAPSEEAEGGTPEGPQAPVDEVAEALVSLIIQEERSTADAGDGVEEGVQALDRSPFYASQATHAHTPQRGQALTSSWPQAPIGPPQPGVRPPFSPSAGTFMGVAQGLPMPPPPSSTPALHLGPRGALRLGSPPGHVLHGPSKPLVFPGASAMPPSHGSSPPAGSAGPPQFGGISTHILQRPVGPLGPFPSAGGGTDHGAPLGAARHPSPPGPASSLPSMPFPSGPLPPSISQPNIGGPPHAAPALPRMGSPLDVSPSKPSGLGPKPQFLSGPTFRPRFPPDNSTPSPFGPQALPPSQPSAIEGLSLGLLSLALSGLLGPEASEASAEPSSRISGIYLGSALGDPSPSSTSVSTAPPPS
ncbi:hypothetical protein ACSSS7_004689 [Eimeria intestinalis]